MSDKNLNGYVFDVRELNFLFSLVNGEIAYLDDNEKKGATYWQRALRDKLNMILTEFNSDKK